MPRKKHQTPISAKFRKLPPRKPKNKDYRSREYLTDAEIEKLRKAARSIGRHGVHGMVSTIQIMPTFQQVLCIVLQLSDFIQAWLVVEYHIDFYINNC